ncbi:MAG: glycosyltransferase family 4 protein [Paludibacteraceae bacterium]|nr:glycosyltransferase family 4 protein [Paludibacteraceae bacterium]
MKIGFDAKRAFCNSRGLGNYSRDTIRLLSQQCPEHDYTLFTPKINDNIKWSYNCECTSVVKPQGLFAKKIFSSIWRTWNICDDIKRLDLDIYHGLSHELPYGIEKTRTKRVVTMHDLIFLKNPELFPLFDRYSFKKKYTHGCKTADKVIAISEETKRDLIEYMHEEESRIEVVYQGCNPVFHQPVSEQTLEEIRNQYALPKDFMLIICAIERRKNHELILKAMRHPQLDLPLVIVGRPSDYKKHLDELIHEYGLENRVIFLDAMPTSALPALYKLATVFVYPSLFEGFGIPILESLTMGTPVVTSEGSCFRETGGEAAKYVDCNNSDQLAETLLQVLQHEEIQKEMVAAGLAHAQKFSDESIARNIMSVYKQIL